jgi:hypothetical protein
MHDCTAVMGGSNENGLRHFHILCTTTGRSLAVPMKMASPFSYFMPDRTAVMGGWHENRIRDFHLGGM